MPRMTRKNCFPHRAAGLASKLMLKNCNGRISRVNVNLFKKTAADARFRDSRKVHSPRLDSVYGQDFAAIPKIMDSSIDPFRAIS
jgi:hypothetical protein